MKRKLQKQLYQRISLRLICFLVLSSGLPGISYATNRERSEVTARVNITGTVKDSKGEPLPGVSVKIKGTNTGASTDVNGVFRINLPTGNETLVFTYVGFTTKEIAVNGRTQLNVELAESSQGLDEVVVTGYGTKKKSELIGSVATISGEELMDIPAPNIAGALRNKIAGVSVDQTSGRPGASITLNIRNASISEQSPAGTTAEPLYIVDGITVGRDAFNAIDPSMIENLTFLKDASAAIYGASGAKGVVLVTTKRGKEGKPSLSYNGYFGVSDAASTPEMLSGYDHAVLLNDTYRIFNKGGDTFFLEEDLEYIKGLNYKSWFDELWKSAFTQRHNLSISGGSEKITFFAGGNYQNENGNYAGLKQDKYGFRSGLTATILEGLKADIAFNVDHTVQKSKNSVTESDQSFFESMVSVPRWVPISIDGMPVNFNNASLKNPLAILQSGYYDDRKTQGYRVNASLTYQPRFLKGLTAKFQVSQGGDNSTGTLYDAPYKLYNFLRIGNNSAIYSTELNPDPTKQTFEAVSSANSKIQPGLKRGNSYQGFFTLQYGNTFGKHSFDIIVGGEQSATESEDLIVYWQKQLIPGSDDYWAFDVNTLTRHSRQIYETTKRSFFSRLNYDIDKKYLLEAVARLDASSNFASGNRWGLSPSIGLGWVVSREDFFKDNVPFIDFLKLKVNYGITGDDRIDQRLWQERYTVDVTNGYLYGNTNTNGINPSVFPNPDITWEKKQTFNAGVELSMFNNKLDLGVEVFRNYTYDGFDRGANSRFPFYAGFLAPAVNYREAYNWGSEFNIGYKAKLAKDLNLSTSINFSYGNSVIDRVIYTPGDLQENRATKWLTFGTDPRKYNSSNIGLKSNGMFRTQAEVDAFLLENPNYTVYAQAPQAGWLRYEDTNGDGIINDYDMVPLFNNTNPFFSSGISFNLSYKAFSLNSSIYAKLGGKVFYDSKARTAPSNTRNILAIWKDRWTPENPMEGKYPRFDDPSIGKNSDFWAVDGTTIRVNNMTLSYKLPSSLANKLGIGGARALLTGNNLWTIVNPLKYKDPYTSTAYDYPTIRTISLGFSVNF